MTSSSSSASFSPVCRPPVPSSSCPSSLSRFTPRRLADTGGSSGTSRGPIDAPPSSPSSSLPVCVRACRCRSRATSSALAYAMRLARSSRAACQSDGGLVLPADAAAAAAVDGWGGWWEPGALRVARALQRASTPSSALLVLMPMSAAFSYSLLSRPAVRATTGGTASNDVRDLVNGCIGGRGASPDVRRQANTATRGESRFGRCLSVCRVGMSHIRSPSPAHDTSRLPSTFTLTPATGPWCPIKLRCHSPLPLSTVNRPLPGFRRSSGPPACLILDADRA
mmetsp:Transcript_38960/g.111331  ORF Transcript_38960/g.111331 Transcript_38960/m.111331 type:complete len:281 (-) Transcript_38960:232-1074(-)